MVAMAGVDDVEWMDWIKLASQWAKLAADLEVAAVEDEQTAWLRRWTG